MATIRVLLGIICLGIAGSGGLFSSGVVENRLNIKHANTVKPSKYLLQKRAIENKPALILSVAIAEIGIRESTRNNDGKRVEEYLQYTGNKKGDAWCASFVSWVHGKAGFAKPRTAWSPALFPVDNRRIEPTPAMVFGIYFANLKRIAHCGLVEKVSGKWINTIEGNTNLAGSREGDGVYRKIRHATTIKYYSDWMVKGGKM